jgi:starvation-inducible DNA-binding protein
METWNGFRLVGSVEDDTVESVKSEKLVDKLKVLLADVAVFYHAVHEFHWNVKGSDFYEYHKFYDEIVSDVYESIDPIAENVRKLGGTTNYHMSQLIRISSLNEPAESASDSRSLTNELIRLNSNLIDMLNNVFSTANKENQQGVANFIAERIDMHQKWNWFLTSSVDK